MMAYNTNSAIANSFCKRKKRIVKRRIKGDPIRDSLAQPNIEISILQRWEAMAMDNRLEVVLEPLL